MTPRACGDGGAAGGGLSAFRGRGAAEAVRPPLKSKSDQNLVRVYTSGGQNARLVALALNKFFRFFFIEQGGQAVALCRRENLRESAPPPLSLVYQHALLKREIGRDGH